jgi:CRP-like cAMP-binding protein
MLDSKQTSRPLENQILGCLPPEEQQRLRPLLHPVSLAQYSVVFEAGMPLSHVLFIDEGIVSIVSTMSDGATMEIGIIGNEGLAGIRAVMGVETVSYRHTVQIAGRGRRFSTAALRNELRHDSQLRRLLNRYCSAFMTQVMQSVACSGLHSVEQRCCRWLLTAYDRLGTPEFDITHDFLARMLGVRRASVTDVLRPLQNQGLISSRRGHVTILDAKRLAANSCECYDFIRGEYQRLLEPPHEDCPQNAAG